MVLLESDSHLFDDEVFARTEEFDPMRDFPQFGFSMREVRRAGEIIAGPLHWNEESQAKILEAFRVANNWRDSHAWPMRSVRGQIIAYMRHCSIEGITAARLKRMQAIRRKLNRVRLHLNQYQDLGGCRAILKSNADIEALVGLLKERVRHEVRDKDDYIRYPKADGYRSRHLVLSYLGKGVTRVFDGRKIEVQLRTQIQHSWATAVEAVGLYRREDLKGGYGNREWLRLFALMSAEFAEAEGCPIPDGIPSRSARVREIRDLDSTLGAINLLDNVTLAFEAANNIRLDREKSKYFLINCDAESGFVDVKFYDEPILAIKSYDNAEATGNRALDDKTNIVLVEVDKIENLRKAYPNYFGDVQQFKAQLKNIIKGKAAKIYAVRPSAIVQRPREKPDLSWLRRRGRWFDPK